MESKRSGTTTPNSASPRSSFARRNRPQPFAIESRQIQGCQQPPQQQSQQ